MGTRIAALLALVVALTLTACGGNTEPAADATTTASFSPEPASFGQSRTYLDGRAITVVNVQRLKPNPALAINIGLPSEAMFVRYSLQLTNGSETPWNTARMTVSSLAGRDRAGAVPVCRAGGCPPAEQIAPGDTITATYVAAFAEAAPDVTFFVAPDTDHAAACWVGPV